MIKIVANKRIEGFTRKTGTFGGLFKISDDLLFCNIIHGNEDGSLFIEPDNDNIVRIHFVKNFRFMLFQLLGVEDTGQTLLINPCYPQSIIKYNGSLLDEQNIKVLEFGANKLCRTHQNVSKLHFYVNWRQTRRDFLSFEEMEKAVDETITCLSDLDKTKIEYSL